MAKSKIFALLLLCIAFEKSHAQANDAYIPSSNMTLDEAVTTIKIYLPKLMYESKMCGVADGIKFKLTLESDLNRYLSLTTANSIINRIDVEADTIRQLSGDRPCDLSEVKRYSRTVEATLEIIRRRFRT